MPRVRIHNRTKVAETVLPNGVALEITVGNDKRRDLAVDETRTYDVPRGEVVRITPKNRMVQQANWLSDAKKSDLYIIPANQTFGVEISYNDPDD
jgi:hypothetical protein